MKKIVIIGMLVLCMAGCYSMPAKDNELPADTYDDAGLMLGEIMQVFKW
jgi:hypothetical protein